MNVIVTDKGFGSDDPAIEYSSPEELDAGNPVSSLELPADIAPENLAGKLFGVAMIRVGPLNFGDGRGFTIARQLRLMGYRGRLRAYGHVIADQYAMARRSGFDEVEISAGLATRQPEDQWMARADWKAHDYQSRLGSIIGVQPAAKDN